jgi:hypothetical protein
MNLTVLVVARVLQSHRTTNPIVLNRLVRSEDNRIALGHEDIEAVDRVWNMINAVHLIRYDSALYYHKIYDRRQFTYLNNGERVAFDGESEGGIGGSVDYSEPVALSRLDIDSSAHDLWAPIISTNTVDKARVGDLFEFVSQKLY